MISGRGGAGGRAGRIRPPRRVLQQPNGVGDETDVETCWNMLQGALRDVHRKCCGELSFEQLYRAAYKIVLRKKGHVLYERVKQFEEAWFAEHVTPKITVLVTSSLVNIGSDRSNPSFINERSQTGEKFLKGLLDTWADHLLSMNMIADILMYLDRGYAQQEPGRVSIYTLTVALFRDHILRSSLNTNSSDMVIDLVTSVVNDQIDRERQGDLIDRALIRSCCHMLSNLYETNYEIDGNKLYLTVFEPRFLRNSQSFYAAECQRLLRGGNASAWLRQVQRRLHEEEDRCGTTIEPETFSKVSSVVDDTLIRENLADFLAMEGSGLRWMVDNDKIDDLSLLYKILMRVETDQISLRNILHKRVIELGLEIETALKTADFSAAPTERDEATDAEKTKVLTPAAQQTAVAIKWVDDVLQLKMKFDTLLTKCFQNDFAVQTTLSKSFADFINMFPRSSEFVSLFIDENLKRGIRGKSEGEIDTILERAVVLIRYLTDQDLFQTYYLRHLARRLLHGKSESHDAEKQLVSRMKQELGQQFTSKFEGMFRDLVTSSELTSSYRDHVRNVSEGEKVVELDVSVLTSNCWPQEIMGRQSALGVGVRTACNYPAEVQRLQASFEQFYLTNRNGRKLTWIDSTGSADVRCIFPAIPGKSGALAKERRYEINVPTFAMVVMLLFNGIEEGESLSFEEIQAKTNISTPDLMRALTAIAVAPKSRVLAKEPPNKSVKAGDKFAFNASFQSKTVRIKAPIINAVSKVEDAQERKTTEAKNNEARGHIVDAAIVRIMKSRKESSHAQLVSEVLSQLAGRFKPEVSLIKKRIEDLIAREYLERPDEEGAPTMYRYLA